MSWLYSLWYSKAVTLYYARDPLDYPDAIENPPHHPALGPVPADATVAVHLSSARLSGVLYFHDLVVMSARPRDDSRTYRLWSPMQLRNVRRIIKQDMLDVLISAGNVRPHLDSVVSMCENPLHWIPPRDHDEAWARLHHVRCLIIMWNQNALTLGKNCAAPSDWLRADCLIPLTRSYGRGRSRFVVDHNEQGVKRSSAGYDHCTDA